MQFFRLVPDFEYVNRFSGNNLTKYTRSKNIFTRVKIRDEIFQNLMYFEKYIIVADERPDNIARSFYGEAEYDWLVLLSNNILNFYEEWPMPQKTFDEFLIEKYGSYEKISAVKHYKSKQVTNSRGIQVLAKDLIVPEDYSVTFFDPGLGKEVTKTGITIPVTNLDYENELQVDKRNIYLIKPEYLRLVTDQLQELLQYEKGSTQYVSRTLKRGDNIRLFQ